MVNKLSVRRLTAKALTALIIFKLVLIASVFIFNTNTYALENEISENMLYAKAAALIDAQSGRLLYGKNENEVLAMASTTKIMTCILALENCDLSESVNVSKKAALMPKVKLNMNVGEKFMLKDLLYSLMLESHNDSAVAIAEHVAGSVEEFAKMMNDKAEEIGCENTYFITPNGLDATKRIETDDGKFEDKKHSTTAYELAKILAYCINSSNQSEKFLEITRTKNYSFSDLENKRSFSCNNHNAFLNMMQGALTGKTGFTNDAGYCYTGALERDGKTFIVALLGCGWPNNKGYKWKDTIKLMNYALENYEYKAFDEKIDFPKPKVINGMNESKNPYEKAYIEVGEENEGIERILLRKNEKIIKKAELKNSINAPVNAGDIVGKTRYYLINAKGEKLLIKENNLVSLTGVSEIRFYNVIEYIVRIFLM